MSKHTPGPWKVRTIDGSLGTIETADEKFQIAQTFQLRANDRALKHSERLANTALIAAAPELLEALAYIYEDVRQGAFPNDDDPWYERSAAVLAKAKGEI